MEEHYIDLRAQASFLTHEQLDLVILGSTRPALEGGQGRPWPPQLFITPSTIDKIRPSEIIRFIIINYGGQLVLDAVSSSNKVCQFPKQQIGSKARYYQRSLFNKFEFLHYDVDNPDTFLGTCGSIQVEQQ